MVKENLSIVEQNIQKACVRSGRDRREVQLIAVSKTKPVSMIEELLPGNTVKVTIEEVESGERKVTLEPLN